MPPSADSAMAAPFGSMLLPSPPTGMEQKADRYFGKNTRSVSFNGQLHAMPVIPEEDELSATQLSGAQKVLDLLFFALDGDGYDSIPMDMGSVKGNGNGNGNGKSEEFEEMGFSGVEEKGRGGMGGEKSMYSVVSDGWGLKFLRSKGARIHHVEDEENLAEVKGREVGGRSVGVGEGWKVRVADVDVEMGMEARVHPPILTVGSGGLCVKSTESATGWQNLFYKCAVATVFALIFVELGALVVVSAFFFGGTAPFISIVGGGGAVIIALLAFNMMMSRKEKMILSEYLREKRKVKVGALANVAHGTTVVVKGKVSAIDSKVIPSELQTVGSCLLVDTCLQSAKQKRRHVFKCKEHVRQTRAVSFSITDEETGACVLVNASAAAELGLVVPLVRLSTALPLTGNLNLVRWLGDEEAVRNAQAICKDAQLTVHEGYICEGDVVTVMGSLNRIDPSRPPVIEPLPKAQNVSMLLFFWNFIPFFYPTWISGLVVSDGL